MRFGFSNAFAFGIPVVFTIFLLLDDQISFGTFESVKNDNGRQICTLISHRLVWLFFYLPSLVVQGLSFMFFTLATVKFRQLMISNASALKLSAAAVKYRMYLSFFIIQVLIWILNFFINETKHFYLILINDILLIIQVIVIFALSVLNEFARTILLDKLRTIVYRSH